MSTATRGTVLAGRYRLEERIQSNADGALWRAVDGTLDRRVSIRVMRPGHPFAADVADAARRAALVEDARLVRVLDVGSDGDIGFVVSEDVDGDSLAALVERSPLAAPVVRRIVGEVAQGLTAAAARGLHHLCLTPRSVIVCRDGSVKIVGTAVEAAAAGLEPAHAASAGRDDATALVGLLYSGLTGRWPLGNTGFPPAPRGVGGDPVPPADLVRGIPNDLDTLCVVTLSGRGDGPRSPAELVRELAPWPSAEEAPLRAAPRRLPSDAPPPPLAPDSPLKIRSRPTAKRAAGAKPPPTNPTKTPAKPAAASAGGSEESTSGPGAPGSTPRRSATMFPTSVALTGSLPIPKEPSSGGPRRMDSLFSPAVEPNSDAPAKPAGPGQAGAAKKAAPSKPPAPTIAPPIARSTPTGRLVPPKRVPPGRSTPASGPQRAPSPEPNPVRAPKAPSPDRPAAGSRPTGGPPGEPLLPWGPNWSKTSGSETNVPFPVMIPSETPPREQSRLVIFSITVVLVLGLVVAAFSLRDLGSNEGSVSPIETGAALPSSTVGEIEPSGPATTPGGAPTTSGSATAASVPVSIASIRAIDPEGDGDEDTASSPLAVDGDESSFWGSQIYRSQTFGGLKNGVGLSIKLKRSTTLTSATIKVNGAGGVVEVRIGSSPDVTSSKLFGRGLFRDGQVTVKNDNAKAGKYVILWFTRLPSVGGKYTVEVSEVRLK